VNLVGGGQVSAGFSPGIDRYIGSTAPVALNRIVEITNGVPTQFVIPSDPFQNPSVNGNYSQSLVIGYTLTGAFSGTAPGILTVPANPTFVLNNSNNNTYTTANIGDEFIFVKTSAAGFLPVYDAAEDVTLNFIDGTINYAGAPPTVSSFTWTAGAPTLAPDAMWAVDANSTILRLYVAPIPEPGMLMVIGAGLIGLGGMLRSRLKVQRS
jgi:hypothetical protein